MFLNLHSEHILCHRTQKCTMNLKPGNTEWAAKWFQISLFPPWSGRRNCSFIMLGGRDVFLGVSFSLPLLGILVGLGSVPVKYTFLGRGKSEDFNKQCSYWTTCKAQLFYLLKQSESIPALLRNVQGWACRLVSDWIRQSFWLGKIGWGAGRESRCLYQTPK